MGTLTLAWAFKALATAETATNVGGPWKPGDPTYWGGPTDTYRIAGSPLMVDGVMYISAMDRAWAINARTGEQMWSYFFKTRGGHHNNGSKGMGMYGSWLYFETPECVPGFAGRENRQGAVVQTTGARSSRIISAAPRRWSSATMCTPESAATPGTFRDGSMRAIPKPAMSSGSGTPRRRIPAIPVTIRGPMNTRASTAAAGRGSRLPTIRISI